jgi:hypothetical protein
LLAQAYARLADRSGSAAILNTAVGTALATGEVWWLPALYLQRSTIEPPHERETTLRLALDAARAQNSRALEQRIVAASTGAWL